MKIGITGATGLIGREFARHAQAAGHQIVPFSRSPQNLRSQANEARLFSISEAPDLGGLDAIVHLAGESIFGLWTPAKKRKIRDSRVQGTRRVVEGLQKPNSPGIFVCGSATGFYGDTGDNEVDESSDPGNGFLAEVAEAWEAEALKAPAACRTALLRTGVVLSQEGGALKLAKAAFQYGLGGRLGDGRQWMACIHVSDVAGLILHAIENADLRGPLNAVMPQPVRNSDFTAALAKAVHRPAVIPVPKFMLKTVLGELSHILLDSQRVVPTKALATGYAFQRADLNVAVV